MTFAANSVKEEGMSKWVVAAALALAGVQSAWAQVVATQPSSPKTVVAIVPLSAPGNVEARARRFEESLAGQAAARADVVVVDAATLQAAMEKSGAALEWSTPAGEVAKFAREVAKAQVIVYGDVSGRLTDAQFRVRVVDTRARRSLVLDQEFRVRAGEQVAKAADIVAQMLGDCVVDTVAAGVKSFRGMEERWKTGDNLLEDGKARVSGNAGEAERWTGLSTDNMCLAPMRVVGPLNRRPEDAFARLFDMQRRRWLLDVAFDEADAGYGAAAYGPLFPMKSGEMYRFSCEWKSDGVGARFLVNGYVDAPPEMKLGAKWTGPAEVYRRVVNPGERDAVIKSLEDGWKQVTVDFAPRNDRSPPKFGRVVIQPLTGEGSVRFDNIIVKQIWGSPTTKPDAAASGK